MAPVPPLASQLSDRVETLRRVQLFELPAARRDMAATAAALLAVQGLVLERTVVILERAKHGALARATKAKAEHLATVAQGVEGKLEYVYYRLFLSYKIHSGILLLWPVLIRYTGLRNLRLPQCYIRPRHLLRWDGISDICEK